MAQGLVVGTTAPDELIEEYVIWPVDGKNKTLCDAVTIRIEAVVEPAPVYHYITLYDELVWWHTNCTKTQALQIKDINGVRVFQYLDSTPFLPVG